MDLFCITEEILLPDESVLPGRGNSKEIAPLSVVLAQVARDGLRFIAPWEVFKSKVIHFVQQDQAKNHGLSFKIPPNISNNNGHHLFSTYIWQSTVQSTVAKYYI